MNLCFILFVKFAVSNGRHGKEESCEELVREVEGNGVFSQLSLEVRRKLSWPEDSYKSVKKPRVLISANL